MKVLLRSLIEVLIAKKIVLLFPLEISDYVQCVYTALYSPEDW